MSYVPSYTCLQIISYRPYGISVDWWALGILMYEMMVGRVSGGWVGMKGVVWE